jgi:uncharacterized protein with HEPN domain
LREILTETLNYIGYLEQFAVEGDVMFYADIKTQLAVRQAYEVVGDLVKQIPDALLATQPQVAWRELKGMRDILAHQYFQLDLSEVWNSTAELPELRTAIEAILASLSDNPAV